VSTHPCWEGGVACRASCHLLVGQVATCLLGKLPLVCWASCHLFVGQVATCLLGKLPLVCRASFHLPLLVLLSCLERIEGDVCCLVGQVSTCPYWRVLGGGCVCLLGKLPLALTGVFWEEGAFACWASFHLPLLALLSCLERIEGVFACWASFHLRLLL